MSSDLGGDSLDEAAARLEEIAPGYLARVRRRAGQLGLPRSPADRARRSIELVTDTAHIDANAPVLSSRPAGRFVKRVVRSLVRFYFVWLGEQIADLGESTSWMGTALLDYVAGLEAEIADLRERVRCLEEGRGRP